MKIFFFAGILTGTAWAGMQIQCHHQKLTQLEKQIVSHKEMTVKYNTASRDFVKVNNMLRQEICKFRRNFLSLLDLSTSHGYTEVRPKLNDMT